MAGRTWVCSVCGYIHEGDAPPDTCPVCGVGAEEFLEEAATTEEAAPAPASAPTPKTGEYLGEWKRDTDTFERKYARVAALARTGESEVSPMRTQQTFPEWDTILFKGGQLHRMPLTGDVPVTTRTIIGRTAAKPLTLEVPMYVSHMSFGALSKEAKIALAKGATEVGTAMCSGEGGLLPEERENASCYIYELGTAPFSHVDDAIRQADAAEIKIGQAAKPGLGGHLPANKVSEEIAKIRGLKAGEASVSPGRYTGLETVDDLVAEVARVRGLLDGKPVGVKITAGHIGLGGHLPANEVREVVTIDCRGGATGSAPTFLKDNVCLPPIYALRRARRYLDRAGSDITLCITGGFRDSTDIAKALALGADAVALATASLIAIGCQQYRICETGRCPVGITTQDPELRARLDIDRSAARFVRYMTATRRELEILARSNGRESVHDLDLTDIFTLSHEISAYTDIGHA